MNRNFIIALTCTVTFLSQASAFANKAKVAAPLSIEFTELNDSDYQKLLSEGKKSSSSRTVANVDRIDYATAIADDFKNITSDLIGGSQWKDQKEVKKDTKGVTTDSELAAVIESLEAKYSTLSPASQLLSAQLSALKPFRGIFYRLRPLVEAQHTPLVHGMIISFIRGMNSGVNNIFPSEQWKAGFEYLSKPYKDMGPQISTEAQLNTYVAKTIIPSNFVLFNKVAAVKLESPLYMDNRLLWGKSNFVADQDRYVLFGNAEKYSFLSSISFAISGLTGSLAYNWVGMFDTTQDFWTVYGFNTSFVNPDSMTAEKRVNVIKRHSEVFTLLDGGATWTKTAYKAFTTGLKYNKLSWNLIKNSQQQGNSSQTTALDQRGFLPFTRILDTSFLNVDALIKGEGISSSTINGEIVQVDFKKFFNDPPRDFKAFLPTAFEQGDRELKEPVTGLKYRNYNRGNPTAWSISEYQKYFPNVKDANGVRRAARVMNQTWGGSMLGAPVAATMF